MLSQNQKELIRNTIPTLKQYGVLLTTHFYHRMLKHEPKLKEIFNLNHQKTGKQAKALANMLLAYAIHIDNPIYVEKIIEEIFYKHTSLNIQSQDYEIVGKHLLLSISEVLNLPLDHELLQAWTAAYQKLAMLFISKEKEIYSQSAWKGWKCFKIIKKVQESKEVISFYLQPVDGSTLPFYQAGQYITLKVFVPELGYKQPRQYSLSDCSNSSYFRISVKKEYQGYVSNTLHHHLNIDDEIEISAPTGCFNIIEPSQKSIFISGGVGLTPMIAMLKQLVNQPDHQKNIYFIHATKNSDTHTLKAELEDLAQQHSYLNLYTAYETPQQKDIFGKDYHQKGYLDLSQLAEVCSTQAQYYLCGPKLFMQAQYQTLCGFGINPSQIHTENF